MRIQRSIRLLDLRLRPHCGIDVGGIEHETCGFATPSPTAEATTLMSAARTLKYGDELRSLGDANTIVDGLVRGVRESGHELVPLLWIDGNTSPSVTRQSQECAIEDLLVVERTYPHVDMAERAVHTARMMARTLTGEVRPAMTVRYLPLLWSAARMIDAEPPMSWRIGSGSAAANGSVIH